MSPTDAPDALAQRRKLPLGRIVAVLVLLLAIFFVSRGCQQQGIEITKEEAIAIARTQVSFKPDLEVVRLQRRGLSFRPHWAVSLSQRDTGGGYKNVTVVLLDARDGQVVSIKRE